MKKQYDPQWYRSPVNLPEATSGTITLRHRIIPVGQEIKIIGHRQGLLRGQRPVVGMVKEPLRVHELVEDGHGMWMTDLPEELNQIAEMLYHVKPKDRVLVGGLGLGIVASTVAMRPRVKHVTVVERSADVIKLCAQPGYARVHMDILEFLTSSWEQFEYYLLDTWCGTSESTWFDEVLPLRRAIRQRWGTRPVIHCWAEDIMVGQITRTLTHTVPHWYYTYLPVPTTATAARKFVKDAGLPWWEQTYGAAIDRYVQEQANRKEVPA